MKIESMDMTRLRGLKKEYENDRIAALTRLDFDGAKVLGRKISDVNKEIKSRQ
jgi:hypothetical protein